jgi:hypothetical protein
VLFTDVESGPVTGGPDGLGVPIAIYGTGFGSSRGSSTVTIGGVEVARYLQWGHGTAHNPDLDLIVVEPGAAVSGGRVVVSVGASTSQADVRFSVDAGAKILAIAPSGSDSADCSVAHPCATVQAVATTKMSAGDIVLMRGGTYAESEVWIRSDQGHSGAPGRQKVIKAYPGERVLLDNAARPFIVDADYVTVAGIEFGNGKSLGIPDTGLPGHRGDRFVDNSFVGTIEWGAIDTHGDDHLVAGNVCDVSGSTVGTQGHCYYISYGSGVQLRYNVGRGAPGYGIHVFDQQRRAGDFRRTITNLLIEGNTLTGSSERSGLILAMNDEGGVGNLIDGVIVRANRLGANNHLGALVIGKVHNVVFTGNTFDQNGRQGLHIADDPGIAGVTVSGNTFIQSANANCHLFCTWYDPSHLQVGARASAVTVSGNHYEPAPPVVLGATDTSPS